MPRAKGTFMTTDRWVAELAPTLPGCAGWVLLELSYQANYEDKQLTVAELTRRVHRSERPVQEAVNHLLAHGYAVPDPLNSAVMAAGSASNLAQALRTNQRARWEKKYAQHTVSPFAYPAITGGKREEVEKEKKEQIKNPLTPQGEARNITAPGVQDQTPAQLSEPVSSPDGEAADAAPVVSPVQVPAQPVTRQTEQATSTEKVPAARRRAAALAEPTAFQALFGAVALACYGGHDGLTDITRIRIGKVGKSLSKAGYTAADVELIVAELRQEQWRDSITPSVIEAEAPAWRARQRGSLPARPERPHVLKFTPRPQTTEAANQRAAQRASDIYAALQEDTRAIF